ncbi:unnamed protein product [Chondrus crispus]|uniref:Uncharacterized protein n=1 Tax=Chondrus crispus TaxID=2769 RepID=R7Q3W1_CHOCR|nr:unnamed protein product [Chondrus crispus]CDF33222.1 unnamed protein product [Chondrus crispus]|eukprot:XP_005713025.1 unnamed protein product [Chondrus crispus]
MIGDTHILFPATLRMSLATPRLVPIGCTPLMLYAFSELDTVIGCVSTTAATSTTNRANVIPTTTREARVCCREVI